MGYDAVRVDYQVGNNVSENIPVRQLTTALVTAVVR